MFCHLGLFFFSWCVCYLKGRSLRCSPGRGNAGRCAVTLYVGRGREGAMVPALLSTGFQTFTPLPKIKLFPSGAGSRVGGLVHTLGPCGSLQQPLLGGWESLLLPPQPPRVFSLRSLRLYFPALEPWFTWSASLPAVHPGLSVRKCGATGSTSGETACPVHPTLHQSQSRHGHVSPLHPGARLRPSYQSG